LIAQRQAAIAEQARLAKLKQQLEARTEFEKQIAQAIKAYFDQLKQAKIEAEKKRQAEEAAKAAETENASTEPVEDKK
jgi:inorganic pyrophosphatase